MTSLSEVRTVAKRVSAAQAKAQLSSLSAEVAYGGERVVIERLGKPLVALVSIADLELLGQSGEIAERPQGALALVGAWKEVEDGEFESLFEEIYDSRLKDAGRSVGLDL